MARSNFAANRVTGEGRLQQRLRFVTDLGPSQAPAPLGDRSHSSNESNLKSRDL